MFDRENTKEQRERAAMLENRGWLHNNFGKIQKEYGEKWVAILDGKVAVYSKDIEVVKDVVRERSAEAVVMRIPSADIPTPI